MANVDYTTGTEVDAPAKLTITSSKATFTSLDRDDESYHYLDYGADFFETTFSHDFEWQVDSAVNASLASLWSLANTTDDSFGIPTASGDLLYILQGQLSSVVRLTLKESNGGSITNATPITGLSKSTLYYLTVSRVIGGSYGSLILDVYTDSARTSLFGTTSVTLTKDFKFRYYYPIQAYNSGNNALTTTGYVQNTNLNIGGVGSLVNKGLTNDGLTGGRLCI